MYAPSIYALRRPALAWRIILLGLPNAASSLLSGFASTFSNQLLSGYGTDAIAAMGATGSALSATVVSVLRQGALLIPLLYLMHAGFGLPGIAIAHALADLIATGIGMALFLRQYRRVRQSAIK